MNSWQGFRSTGLTGRGQETRWEDIRRITLHPSLPMLTFHADGRKRNAHMHLVGFEDFLEHVQRQTPKDLHVQALTAVRAAMKRLESR